MVLLEMGDSHGHDEPMKKLHFQVDSRLATLLSQEYASTEKALKEQIGRAHV